MASGVGYCIRVLVLNGHGVDGVGLYQASTTLASLYIGLILNAMGVDFYPRLTEVAQDNEACNKLVNEQTEVGLLLAVPGIFATLTFTPLILSIFYSDAFIPAYQILRWEILGVFLRVISWPIAFILLAKKTSKIIFYTELVANLFYLSMAIVGLNYFGLEGAGIAFFSLYVFHVLAMVYIGRKVSNFSWTRSNFYQIITLSLIVISLVAIQFISSSLVSYIVGSFITIGSVSYSAIKLKKYLSSRH